MTDILFHSGNLDDALNQQKQKMINEIHEVDSDYLLNVSTDTFCEYCEKKYRIVVPNVHDNITMELKDITRRDTDTFGREYRIPSTKYVFFVPYEGEKEIFKLRPSVFDLNPPRAEVRDHELVFTYNHTLSAINAGDDTEAIGIAIRKSFNSELESVKNYLKIITQDVEKFHTTLRQQARQTIESRKSKLLNDRGIGSAIGFPLRQRKDIPSTSVVPSVLRKSPARPTASTKPFEQEATLSLEEYKNILNIVNNMVMVVERSPRAFQTMNEEDLRQHFLVQLNGHYEGQASGETFNFEGKTDILIRIGGKNIFIAECKFWKGPKLFTETIDQILGYTSWRDTKTAIIVFNRNKNFSDVLKKIPEVATSHPNYRKTLQKISETQFAYIFAHRDDPNRELFLTVLAFEVPE